MFAPEGVRFTTDSNEPDPRWMAVDHYTLSHLHPSTRPNHGALHAALAASRDAGLPDIATYPVLSKMLALQCRFGQVEHVLEVGTLGGYTALWLTSMNPNLRVTAVEVNAKHAQVAKENLKKGGVADRVEIIVGNAMKELPKLVEDVKAGKRKPIGLTYIDADKSNNLNYLNFAVDMSRPGAAIFVDNVVWWGALAATEKLSDPELEEDMVAARELVESVGKNDKVDAVVQQTVAESSYDGYLMAVVR